jgi:hypothetical protein
MSNRYKGGVISATPPTTTGGESGTASGAWTLEQQMQLQAAGLWPLQPTPKYIEDVFSTYLYTGTGANGLQIPNGVNLAENGGLVIGKARSGALASGVDWGWVDTVRGGSSVVYSNSSVVAQATAQISSFNSNGFTLNGAFPLNYYGSPYTYASWTFREQPKFFDIVTYTGNGVYGRQISHALGSVPGAIFVKSTTSPRDWAVYHRSLGGTQFLKLNSAAGAATASSLWADTNPSSTTFTVGDDQDTNLNGATFVAYIFAHNAGGFGLSGSENVITCGSSSTNSSGNDIVDLDFEPQWVMIKPVGGGGNWQIRDIMRGFSRYQFSGASLFPNSATAELAGSTFWMENQSGGSNGFRLSGSFTSQNYIYIVIRRGPMAVPTVGTTVFSPVAQAGNGGNDTITTGFPTDLVIGGSRTANPILGAVDRLRSNALVLLTANNAAEDTSPSGRDLTSFDSNTGFTLGYPPFATSYNYTGNNIYWNFRRAPSFFDEVCYTGNSTSGRTITHNLTVAPQLMIVKRRSASSFNGWPVYVPTSTAPRTNVCFLNTTAAATDTSYFNLTAPTSTVFSVDDHQDVNASGNTYVAYLFASCPGVSKVGSVTHVEPTTVVCGFIPRFIMIKSTTATGTDDWFVFDSARGLVPGNDPYLRLNSTGAENTPFGAADLVDVTSDGFIMNGFSGGNYIFLAIA